jgi:hypothetical protein
MSTGKTKQNDLEKQKERKWPIPVAIIGALGVIIAALITALFVMCPNMEIEVTVYITDASTGEKIPGNVFIDDDKNPTQINQANGTVVLLKKGGHSFRAESKGYYQKTMAIDRVPKSLEIKMESIPIIEDIPLSFAGWESWELSINEGPRDNEITVNGNLGDAGGFFKDGLRPVLRGKTLVLYFSNVRNSVFNPRDRMVKLTYNRNDTILQPVHESVKYGGYIPTRETPLDRGIEFKIPDDFDGKIGFVFYQAELRDLRITAYYK